MKTEVSFDRIGWEQNESGYWLKLKVKNAAVLKQIAAKPIERLHIAKLEEYKEKRSLNANAYAWKLMDLIAEKIGSTKDEVYLSMLDRYGVFTHIIVKPYVVESIKREWRTVRELGEVVVNGQEGVQLQCFFGSSTYNTKEMARLIDGIVSECKELEIETMPPEKLELLKESWGM